MKNIDKSATPLIIDAIRKIVEDAIRKSDTIICSYCRKKTCDIDTKKCGTITAIIHQYRRSPKKISHVI